MKSERIKICAKLDTLEDRLSYYEKKLDEKLRFVNDLANLLK